MRVLTRTWRQSRCHHLVATSSRTVGVERLVCESCGLVSVHFSDPSGSTPETGVDRAVFARPSDRDQGDSAL